MFKPFSEPADAANIFSLGKLYKCPDFHMFLYPTVDKAIEAGYTPGSLVHSPDSEARYWAKRLACQIAYTERRGVFLLLKEPLRSEAIAIAYPGGHHSVRYLYVLFGEKVGWLIWPKFWPPERADLQ